MHCHGGRLRCCCTTSQDISTLFAPSSSVENYSRTLHWLSFLERWIPYEHSFRCWRTHSALTWCCSWLGMLSLVAEMMGPSTGIVIVLFLGSTHKHNFYQQLWPWREILDHFWSALETHCRHPGLFMCVVVCVTTYN